MKEIKRIVITGGPCSGKTSFLNYAREYFPTLGYTVLIDNEAATDLISGGISPMSMGMLNFQSYVTKLQLIKEELFYEAALQMNKDKIIIFYDRGILDNKAYVSEEEIEALLHAFGTSQKEVMNNYDLVIHLSSAAKGAEKFYTTENNAARYESLDEAIIVDDKTLDAWECFDKRVIINNDTGFEEKMQKTIQAIENILNK